MGQSTASLKARGATYTPTELASFVADRMLLVWRAPPGARLRVLDPAVGDGELLQRLLERLPPWREIEVVGYDTDARAVRASLRRVRRLAPRAEVRMHHRDFLAHRARDSPPAAPFDLVIANPPYVRTQRLGAASAGELARRFGLTGRVDLYHAFVLAISDLLRPDGVAGIIVSNRFMTTRSGAQVRRALRERFALAHAWDLGDTKLFGAAVLPAVVVLNGLDGAPHPPPTFTSVYQTTVAARAVHDSIISALDADGVVGLRDGRRFRVRQGGLDSAEGPGAVWRIATAAHQAWLATVRAHTDAMFGDLGPIRVGVKTCADRVFIRDDWDTWTAAELPELLRAVTTHRVARRYRAMPAPPGLGIVYPHEVSGGVRRAIDLARFPRTCAYLEAHRPLLEGRRYLRTSGRQWHELWVPQDPSAWGRPKLVWRDISREPCFWFDREGTVVNGDCYWLAADQNADEDRLWLALAVGNSSFAARYYDLRFGNRLYGGRRRYITQYVEHFPLPQVRSPSGRAIVRAAKRLYGRVGTPGCEALDQRLDAQVWAAFGLEPVAVDS